MRVYTDGETYLIAENIAELSVLAEIYGPGCPINVIDGKLIADDDWHTEWRVLPEESFYEAYYNAEEDAEDIARFSELKAFERRDGYPWEGAVTFRARVRDWIEALGPGLLGTMYW